MAFEGGRDGYDAGFGYAGARGNGLLDGAFAFVSLILLWG